jgi:hypothetical protein
MEHHLKEKAATFGVSLEHTLLAGDRILQLLKERAYLPSFIQVMGEGKLRETPISDASLAALGIQLFNFGEVTTLLRYKEGAQLIFETLEKKKSEGSIVTDLLTTTYFTRLAIKLKKEEYIIPCYERVVKEFVYKESEILSSAFVMLFLKEVQGENFFDERGEILFQKTLETIKQQFWEKIKSFDTLILGHYAELMHLFKGIDDIFALGVGYWIIEYQFSDGSFPNTTGDYRASTIGVSKVCEALALDAPTFKKNLERAFAFLSAQQYRKEFNGVHIGTVPEAYTGLFPQDIYTSQASPDSVGHLLCAVTRVLQSKGEAPSVLLPDFIRRREGSSYFVSTISLDEQNFYSFRQIVKTLTPKEEWGSDTFFNLIKKRTLEMLEQKVSFFSGTSVIRKKSDISGIWSTFLWDLYCGGYTDKPSFSERGARNDEPYFFYSALSATNSPKKKTLFSAGLTKEASFQNAVREAFSMAHSESGGIEHTFLGLGETHDEALFDAYAAYVAREEYPPYFYGEHEFKALTKEGVTHTSLSKMMHLCERYGLSIAAIDTTKRFPLFSCAVRLKDERPSGEGVSYGVGAHYEPQEALYRALLNAFSLRTSYSDDTFKKTQRRVRKESVDRGVFTIPKQTKNRSLQSLVKEISSILGRAGMVCVVDKTFLRKEVKSTPFKVVRLLVKGKLPLYTHRVFDTTA